MTCMGVFSHLRGLRKPVRVTFPRANEVTKRKIGWACRWTWWTYLTYKSTDFRKHIASPRWYIVQSPVWYRYCSHMSSGCVHLHIQTTQDKERIANTSLEEGCGFWSKASQSKCPGGGSWSYGKDQWVPRLHSGCQKIRFFHLLDQWHKAYLAKIRLSKNSHRRHQVFNKVSGSSSVCCGTIWIPSALNMLLVRF